MATNINKAIKISQKHLLGIQDLKVPEIKFILNEAQQFIELNRSKNKKLDLLKGKTQINLFFEPSTRTQSSFELAGKRLGADVMSMNITNSAIKKGEICSRNPIGLAAALSVSEPSRGQLYGNEQRPRIQDGSHGPEPKIPSICLKTGRLQPKSNRSGCTPSRIQNKLWPDILE